MKRSFIVIVSIVVGWVFGTFSAVALNFVGVDIPASMAKTYSQYNTYSGAVVLVLTVFFSWAMYQVLAARFLERKVDDRPFLERLPSSVRHPSVAGLVIAWVVAVFTVVIYPVAIYMSRRFYVERRDAESKVCPRCAERVKAAALVCRHCSQPFETSAVGLEAPLAHWPTKAAPSPVPPASPTGYPQWLAVNDGRPDVSAPSTTTEPQPVDRGDRPERGRGTFLVESSEVDYLDPRDLVQLVLSDDGLEIIGLGAPTMLPFVVLGAEALDSYVLQLSLSGQPMATFNWCDEGLDARGVAAKCM